MFHGSISMVITWVYIILQMTNRKSVDVCVSLYINYNSKMNLKSKTIGSKDKSSTKELPIEHITSYIYVARTSHLSLYS